MTTAFIGAMITLFMVPIPGANDKLLTYMLGQLSGFVGSIFAAHYTRRADQPEIDARRSQRENLLLEAATGVPTEREKAP